MAEDLDDLPPLEDMTEVLEVVRQRTKPAAAGSQSDKSKTSAIQNAPISGSNAEGKAGDAHKGRSAAGIGGTTTKPTRPKIETLEAPDPSELRYANVVVGNSSTGTSQDGKQAAKQNEEKEPASSIHKDIRAALSKPLDDVLLTPQAIQSVFSDKDLLKAMMTPKIQEAIAEFGKDPAGAREKYALDKEVTEFFTKWMAKMRENVPDFEKRAVEEVRRKQKTLDVDPANSGSVVASIANEGSAAKAASSCGKTPVLSMGDPESELRQVSPAGKDKDKSAVKPAAVPGQPKIEVVADSDEVSKRPTPTTTSTATTKKSISAAATSGTSKQQPPSNMPKLSGRMVKFGPEGREVPVEIVQNWLSNPVIVQALNDPMTNQMLDALRKDENIFPQLIRDPRIQILVRAGILQVPPKYRS